MNKLVLLPVPGNYSIHRLPPGSDIPESLRGFYSVTVSDEEVSIVCRDDIGIKSEQRSSGWKCVKIEGPLDLEMVGIINKLTGPLRVAGINVFAISTFDTDYLLVPGESYQRALKVLGKEFIIRRD
jgi:hypothetical protein